MTRSHTIFTLCLLLTCSGLLAYAVWGVPGHTPSFYMGACCLAGAILVGFYILWKYAWRPKKGDS